MKIVADKNIPMVEEAFSAFGTVVVVSGRDIAPRTVQGAEMLLVRSVTTVNDTLLEGSSVRFVATATIGTDHVATEWLRDRCIGFAAAPGSNARSVAQYVLGAIVRYYASRGYGVGGKTIGVVGAGNVGSKVARLLQALGARILLCDPPLCSRMASGQFVDLHTLLEHSDCVTLHVPLSRVGPYATYRMANADFFGRMRDGALFINTSRGGVVNEGALKQARHRLGGLVLDVWEGEPKPDPDLVEAADIATAHIAGYSVDGKLAGLQMVYDAACAFYFRKPAFCAAGQIAGSCIDLDVSLHPDPLSSAIVQACGIEADSREMKKSLALSCAKRGEWFDHFRAGYRQRMEFSHYRVHAPSHLDPQLRELGFSRP